VGSWFITAGTPKGEGNQGVEKGERVLHLYRRKVHGTSLKRGRNSPSEKAGRGKKEKNCVFCQMPFGVKKKGGPGDSVFPTIKIEKLLRPGRI